MRLTIDGTEYRDQYADYGDHLGDPGLGTSWAGSWGAVSVATGWASDATTYYLGLPEPAPDLLLKRRHEPDSAYALPDEYQQEPAAGQRRTGTAAIGGTTVFDVRLENDGEEARTFVLRATESGEAGWTVVYRAAGEDISVFIRGTEGYETPTVAPGGQQLLSIEFTPGVDVPALATVTATLKVYVSATATTARDAVAAVVTQGLEVNSTGDAPDAEPGDGVCDADADVEGDQCTFRAALEEAAARSGKDAIGFAIPLSVPGYQTSPAAFVIAPETPLPDIAEALAIDGTTQSGGRVVLDGAAAGAGTDGLRFLAGSSSLVGLGIRSFGGDGLVFDNGTPSEIELETDPELYRLGLSEVEITGNCGWGIGSGGGLRLGYEGASAALSRISSNGLGDGCQGGGILVYGELALNAANVEVAGNGGTGILARTDVFLAGTAACPVRVNANRGYGIQAEYGMVHITGLADHQIVSNQGKGIYAGGAEGLGGYGYAGNVIVESGITIRDNASWGVDGRGVSIGYVGNLAGAGLPALIADNGKGPQCWVGRIEDGDAVMEPLGSGWEGGGVLGHRGIEGGLTGGVKLYGAEISGNGADGVQSEGHATLAGSAACPLAVVNNLGAGIRTAGDLELTQGRVCFNGLGNIIAAGTQELVDLGPCNAVSIGGGAGCVGSSATAVSLMCPIPAGCVAMTFSDDGSAWSAPEPFAAARAWDLPAGNGIRTVHARFQDAAGNWSAGYVDTVLVNTSGTQPSSLSTTYAAGWNMVSLPVLPEDRQVSALFPDAVSAFAFAEGYAQISELQVCTGYWVNLEQGGTYTWAGAPCTECARSLPSGWSMLGVPYGGSAAATIQQTPASSVLAIFGFAGQYRQVGSPTGELWPGAGYWVNLAQPGLLVVSGGTAGASWPGGPVPEPVGPALWVESAGSRQPISLGVGPEGVVALPPPPPAGAFDARVIVDGVGAWSVPAGQTAAVYALQVQGAVQRLAWTVPTEMRGQWSLQVGTEQVELAGTGSVAHAPGVSLWLHRHGARPAAFAVGPNHPNPFNASTTIGFQLPQAARVTLSVYDLAGQSVRALHLGEKGPGRHWVEWDGRGDDGLEVATGVYLYEVRAGGLRAVRRMLVLR